MSEINYIELLGGEKEKDRKEKKKTRKNKGKKNRKEKLDFGKFPF